jgi:hypothetical protein
MIERHPESTFKVLTAYEPRWPEKRGAMENSAQEKDWAVLIYMVADDPQGGEPFDQAAHRELDRIIGATIAVDGENTKPP